MRAMVALLLIAATPAGADTPLASERYANTELPDRVKEDRARALMATLRCLVCQGQSIADSDADMAGDMRALVRQRIASGEKPAAIRDWLIARYGSYVSYDPPMTAVTWPLWIAPIVLLAIGAMLASGSFRKRR